MKKLTASLIALALCAFMPTAQAWHTEYFTRADGLEDCRIVLDEWDKEPLSFSVNVDDEGKEESKKIKPVDDLTFENEGSNTIVIDRKNLQKWRCERGNVQTTCREIPY